MRPAELHFYDQNSTALHHTLQADEGTVAYYNVFYDVTTVMTEPEELTVAINETLITMAKTNLTIRNYQLNDTYQEQVVEDFETGNNNNNYRKVTKNI